MFNASRGRVLVAVLLQVLTWYLPGWQQGHWGEMAPREGSYCALSRQSPVSTGFNLTV